MTLPDRRSVPTYGAYLQLDRLLSAQLPPDFAHLSPADDPQQKTRGLAHHDELLFIVVHQNYELWFKLILHELRHARDLLLRRTHSPRPNHVPEEDIPHIVAAVQRVNEIFQIAVQQWRVMETMNPTSFLEFRDLIIPASGFQSLQFRELEILAGLRDDARVDFEGVPYATNLTPPEQARMDRARTEGSLREALFDWLARTPIDRVFPNFGEHYLNAFKNYIDEQSTLQDQNPNLAASQREAARSRLKSQVEEARHYLLPEEVEPRRAHQAFLFIASYRASPLLRWPSTLLDTLIEFEQHFRLFRFRHARMVERMIGSRIGTGGSPGVAYLDRTSQKYKIFGDLLEARSYLLAQSRVPPLPNPTLLDFRFASAD